MLKSLLPITGGLRYTLTNRNEPTRPIGTNYSNTIMDICGLTGKQSPHVFRHLFSTEMNGRGYNRDWIERQLAHADSCFIREAYNHAANPEQRSRMMQKWAEIIVPEEIINENQLAQDQTKNGSKT